MWDKVRQHRQLAAWGQGRHSMRLVAPSVALGEARCKRQLEPKQLALG